MTPRLLLCFVLVAAVSACAPDDAGTEVTPVETPPTSVAVPPDPTELSYAYPADSTLAYEVTVSQNIAFDASGDAARFGDADLPIDADLVTESEGTTTYTISDGPSTDTVSIDISARFPTTRVAGRVNGATVDNLEEGGVETDLARIDPVDATVIVGPTGREIEPDVDSTQVLGADLAALRGLTNELFASLVGPILAPGEEVGVGDTWETRWSHKGQSGPVNATSMSEIVDFTDGGFVIETRTTTDAYTVDFSRQFRDLFRNFAELEAEGEELPEDLLASLESIRFTISVDESTSVERAEFDIARGIIRSSTKSSTMRLSMVFRSPEDDGSLTGFEIALDIEQTAVFRLVE